MSTIRTTYDDPALAGKTIERDTRSSATGTDWGQMLAQLPPGPGGWGG